MQFLYNIFSIFLNLLCIYTQNAMKLDSRCKIGIFMENDERICISCFFYPDTNMIELARFIQSVGKYGWEQKSVYDGEFDRFCLMISSH